MPEWTEQDEQYYCKMKEIRVALADNATLESIARIIGEASTGKREITGLCGLHGEQDVKCIVFAGVELQCGCQIVNSSGKWEFNTQEERESKKNE